MRIECNKCHKTFEKSEINLHIDTERYARFIRVDSKDERFTRIPLRKIYRWFICPNCHQLSISIWDEAKDAYGILEKFKNGTD